MNRKSPAIGLAAALAMFIVPALVCAQTTAAVRGIVYDERGLPAPGIEVTLVQDPDGSGSEPGEHTTITDEDGGFQFEASEGTHTLKVGGGQIEVFGDAEVIVNLAAGGPAFDVEAVDRPDSAPSDAPVTAVTETITGRVSGLLTGDSGEPVAGARVFVRGAQTRATTGSDGSFEVELPPGEQTLAFVHPDFASLDQEVTVSAGEVTSISVALTPSAVALDDYTVTAPRVEGNSIDLLAERKESDSVTEVIGAEEMSRTGASDAADAVTRVTGITVVGGKYVYVRGLGDRYSSTLLNGASLPSPEPERRVVPLDLFPTDLLESVLVQKTYSPDMPGEFGGGVVMLRTRTFPETFQASAGISTSIDSSSTFRRGLSSPGGKLDWLGVDDGTRRMPPELREATQDAPLKEGDRFSEGGYSAEELERFGELVPNTWALRDRTNLPSLGLQGSIGDGFSLFGKQSGYRLGLTYDHDTDQETREQSYYIVGAGGELERSSNYTFTTTNDNVVLGAILTTGVQLDADDRITLTSVIDRVSDAEDRVYEGFKRDVDSTIRVERHRWPERQLLFEQLAGEHVLESGLGFDWHYVYAQARRLEPDRRETRYDLRPSGQFQLSDRPEGNSRVYSTLVDNSHDAAGSIDIPLHLGELEPVLSLGVAGTVKDRAVDTRRFKYFGDSLDPAKLALPPEDLFVPENIGADGLQFIEVTRPTDNYSANQEIAAGWVDTTWPLHTQLQAGLGARLEFSRQIVETFEPFNPTATPTTAELQTLDVLPAAFATWSLNEAMKLRLAGSRTVSRPDFRELSPMLFNDVTGGIAVQGNPDLERALITHVDSRWEWYPSPSESLSLGLFFKHFQRPIESILVPGAQQLKTFANATGARNLGAEVEARKSFGFLAEALTDFYVAGNVSLINSRIVLDPTQGVQTSSERPLQGQSPWVINTQLGWDAVEHGRSVAVLFNMVGPSISEVGAQGAPDVYREAVPRLDIVASQKIGPTLKFGLKAKNLLDPELRFSQGDRVVSAVREGRELSLSIGADF